jgi:hypothetical protein
MLFLRLTFGMLGWLREMEKFMIKNTENENMSKMLWLMVEENYSFVLLDLSYILSKSHYVSSNSRQLRFHSEVSLKFKFKCYVWKLACTE